MAKKSAKQQTIVGPAVPNIPWQDKPKGCTEVIWRYKGNPIIPRDAIPRANSIFNSAVVPFEGQFAGVFRCDDKRRRCNLHTGTSKDGIHWKLDNDPIRFASGVADLPFEAGYDPRVVWLEDRYYVTWCNSMRGWPTIGLAWTKDMKTFHQMENMLLPCNRNGVLFPRKIGSSYAMLSRPSDRGHTPFGDIFYSESPDLMYWGKHRHVMAYRHPWERTKIGPGPLPIETREGWLMLYHGVLTSCNGFTYAAGAALLDIDQPWKVRYRTAGYILNPRELYECVGDTPNVVFPVSVVGDAPTGRMAIYYGGADTVIALAFAQVDELIDYIKETTEA